MRLFGRSVLDGLPGLGPFVVTKVPKGTEPSASATARRGPTALKKCVEVLRAAGGTPGRPRWFTA
jgi:hypothetical protein